MRERFNQARKTIDKILEWAGEQDNFPESYRAEHYFPPKRAGKKEANSEFQKYANSITSSISEDPRYCKTHLNRDPQGINRPIPIEINYNTKETPPSSERQKKTREDTDHSTKE